MRHNDRKAKRKNRRQFQESFKDKPEVAYETSTGAWIKARTPNQTEYMNTLRTNEITICIGPAGTGKTFLATAIGLQMLQSGQISKIVITRPVVEAGEKLGFLPGDMQEKINPYMRPIYDAFQSMLGVDLMRTYIDQGVIEIAPLAYMRGRTLDDAFIILDEAQNATMPQLEMFLTRMGTGSRVVVNGDITQVDLHKKEQSGLSVLENILNDVPGIKFFYFSDDDVVRHPLVKEIVKRYEQWKTKNEKK